VASSSTKRQKTPKGKGKGRRNDEVPMILQQRRESILDYSRYFQTKHQMVAFEKKFHCREVISLKVIDFPFFATSRFQFQEHLNFQGLQQFLSIKLLYHEDMVRVFYSNLHLTTHGYLFTQIGTQKIIIRHRDRMNVTNLKYHGLLLNPSTIPKDIHLVVNRPY